MGVWFTLFYLRDYLGLPWVLLLQVHTVCIGGWTLWVQKIFWYVRDWCFYELIGLFGVISIL